MKVGLNVAERLQIMDILPPEGNIAQLRLIRTLVTRIGFSAKETKDFQILSPEYGKFQWNTKGNKDTIIILEDAEVDLIKKCLSSLNDAEKLTRDKMSTYEKFFPS